MTKVQTSSAQTLKERLMTKICKACNTVLPKTKEFFYFSGNKCQSRCKVCHKEYTKEKLFESRERDRLRREYEKTLY